MLYVSTLNTRPWELQHLFLYLLQLLPTPCSLNPTTSGPSFTNISQPPPFHDLRQHRQPLNNHNFALSPHQSIASMTTSLPHLRCHRHSPSLPPTTSGNINSLSNTICLLHTSGPHVTDHLSPSLPLNIASPLASLPPPQITQTASPPQYTLLPRVVFNSLTHQANLLHPTCYSYYAQLSSYS